MDCNSTERASTPLERTEAQPKGTGRGLDRIDSNKSKSCHLNHAESTDTHLGAANTTTDQTAEQSSTRNIVAICKVPLGQLRNK